jgi:ribosomal protein S18 acetylase RimI-like enzyme
MERVRSLCARLSLAIQVERGSMEWHPGYLVVKTPESPSFWFGNYILVLGRLESGSLALWESRFEEAFGSDCPHRLFIVDSPEGDPGSAEDFMSAGYDREITPSMVYSLPASGWKAGIPPRPELFPEELDGAGMDELLALELEALSLKPEPGVDEEFLRDQNSLYRNLMRRGVARCFALRQEGKIAASASFVLSEKAALISDVRTIPRFRGRGLCRTLLPRAMEMLARSGTSLFVLEPADEYAVSIYRSLGFSEGECLCDILKRPAPGIENGAGKA